MRIRNEQLKEFIKDSGLLDEKELDELSQKAEAEKKDLSQIILSEGKLKENELKRIESYILGVPYVNLVGQKIDFDVLSLIPEPIARKHNIIAFNRTEKELEVAMLDTDDLPAIDFVKKKVGLKIQPRLTDPESIKQALIQYKRSLQTDFDNIIKKETASLKEIAEDQGQEEVSEKDLKKMAEDLPIVKIVDTLLSHAIVQDASDIHIEPHEQELIVRYRIDGILHDAMTLPKNAGAGIIARIKVLSNLKLDEKRLPQDGRFKIALNEQKVSFRVSTLPTYYGEKAVMRVLKDNRQGISLEDLGFQDQDLEKSHKALRQKTGMILVTGPTGSGKTTTLYTMLDILNTTDVNISTVEDPIEYQMPRINQTQVKPDIDFTFSKGLRTLVRQDPDIIMVGEIRDGETAALAVNAALTGHVVLSTIHTNSAAGAIPRLIEMGSEPFLLTSTLNVVISQRLTRRLCSKAEYFLSEKEIEALGQIVDLDRVMKFLVDRQVVKSGLKWSQVPFYKAKASPDCEDGYKGRLGIYEVLTVTPTLKDMIIKNATTDEIEAQAKKEGMTTMIEDGIIKSVMGLTTKEEVLRVVSE